MDWITKLRARRAGILEKMEAVVASIPEGEDMTADQVTEFEALKAEDDKVAADLANAEGEGPDLCPHDPHDRCGRRQQLCRAPDG